MPMRVRFESTGTEVAFLDILREMDEDPDVGSILIFACDENGFVPENCDSVLQAVRKPLIGGVFPKIILDDKFYSLGTVVVGFEQTFHLTIIENLSDITIDLNDAVQDSVVSEDMDSTTLLVFVDGFSTRISGLIDGLFENFGAMINYLGGGAGSLTLVQKPCLMTPKGLLQDAAIIADAGFPTGIGVAHGWEVISEPIKVTKSKGNTIKELNFEPAFKVYKEIVDPRSEEPLTREGFFAGAKGFPFGLRKIGTEVVVRDPIMVGEGDSLVCVGEVPENSFVHILRGDIDRLIDAAGYAKQLAENSLQEKNTSKHSGSIFIDCISRVLFMEQRFGEELEKVYDGDVMVGALTLGEIANSGTDYLEFYNKTAVVGLLP